MGFGHVLLEGGKNALSVVSLMAGHSLIFEEDLDGMGRYADIDLLFDKLV
ncbi:MAG: hypothetical protein GWN33_16190, partial [Gammaproteobacteria bacterium]|nr:hypothetical protein [Gammaproteobacteria bacterium]